MANCYKNFDVSRTSQRKLLSVLIVMVCVLTTTQATHTIKDFHTIWPWDYIGDGLYDVDIGINEGTDAANTTLSNGTIVIAMGDIDDNKHNDLISMSDDQMTVTLNFYHTDDDKFVDQKLLPTDGCKTSAAFIIPNLEYRIAIVCTENISYDYIILFKNDKTNTRLVLSDFKLQKGSQPFFMDINSDTYVDIVYNDNGIALNYPIRVALYNTETKAFETTTLGLFDTYVYVNTTQGCLDIPNKETLKLSAPNFSSLVDVNSDCISDLYMTVDTGISDQVGLTLISTEIKTNEEGSGYRRFCFVESDNLASLNYTSPVFADFNDDAAIDKAFYNTYTNAIHMFYNTRGANGASSSHLCKDFPVISLNERSDYFTEFSIFSGNADITNFENVAGLYESPMVAAFIPGQLRIADLDSNGYPDLITTFLDKEGKAVTTILINSECGDDVSNDIKRNLNTLAADQTCTVRTFNTQNDYSSVSNITDTMYSFLVDFDDNGRMDIVIVAMGDDGTSVLLSYYNNFARDSYYITAITYTTSDDSYGSKVYGINYRGVYTTLHDKNQAFMATQLSRTSYGSLESPVASYAIGRSNNYIEEFTLEYPIQKFNSDGSKDKLQIESKVWTPIIPNSHLLIDIHDKSASKWSIKLLINPTDSFLLVGIILSFILCIIGGIIVYIHMKEKKEDEESRNPGLDFF
jgi:hypothetical protein